MSELAFLEFPQDPTELLLRFKFENKHNFIVTPFTRTAYAGNNLFYSYVRNDNQQGLQNATQKITKSLGNRSQILYGKPAPERLSQAISVFLANCKQKNKYLYLGGLHEERYERALNNPALQNTLLKREVDSMHRSFWEHSKGNGLALIEEKQYPYFVKLVS